MRYYLIAGEASGDLHGAGLIRALRRHDPSSEIRCWGGDQMESAGGTLVKHFRDLAFMGFVEVLRNLRTIFRNLRFCREDIGAYRPDVLILIDYPGFNLRIARWAHQQGIKVIYYISPQVWAWKEGRVRMMKQCIDKMLVILPFEKTYFRERWQWDVDYVGHPLVETIDRFRVKAAQEGLPRFAEEGLPLVALLPGSRRQEILKKLPVMLEASRRFPECRFVVARAPGLEDEFYNNLLQPYPNVTAVSGQTYALLAQARAALVTSGTATLETALFGVPEVVCYKGSWLSYQIGRRVVKVKYISLVNLIMDKPVVEELIQDQLTAGNLETSLRTLLYDAAVRQRLKKDYAALHDLLQAGGHASEKAASIIQAFLAK